MSVMRRGVYRHEEQRHIFNPRSIAIYGMSPTPASPGQRAIGQLKAYSGKIFRVNPRYDRIGDDPCYAGIAALPETPDCVLFAVPREAIEKAVLECADRGVKSVVIFAAGYAETGKPERIAAQDRLAAIGRESGMKIIGPNCMGFANFSTMAVVSFTQTSVKGGMAHPSGIGIVSQSGALGFGMVQASENGVVISHAIATGNSCDVNIADNIAYLAEDPTCNAIACIFEGMSDPSMLLEAADIAWKAGKPLVVAKLGTGEKGAAAAMSHTGSLAGSSAAYKAAFERAGIVVIEGMSGLMEMCSFLSKASRPKARGVGIIASSGGGGIATADMADAFGIDLPQPAGRTLEILQAHVPEYGSTKNPCDVTTTINAQPEILTHAVEAMLSDDQYGALIYPQVTVSSRTGERRKYLGELAKKYGKPFCLPFVGGWVGGPGTAEVERDRNLAWFFNLDNCFKAIAAWHWRDDKLIAEKKNGPRKVLRLSSDGARDKAAKLIAASKSKTLTEREAKEVLACYGVPVIGETLVQSSAQAVSAAQALGFPVAMKVESPDLPHKTEAGVIRLDLKTADEVIAAYEAVMANANKIRVTSNGASPLANPPHQGMTQTTRHSEGDVPRINGVLVQPMAPAGTEIMVGARIDPLFGPLIVAGLGGILVELLKDTAVELAPVTQPEAKAMLNRLKGKAALSGFRGSEPVDLDKLAEVIVRLAEFADDQKDNIAELDVNPLIYAGRSIVAVDALIVRK